MQLLVGLDDLAVVCSFLPWRPWCGSCAKTVKLGEKFGDGGRVARGDQQLVPTTVRRRLDIANGPVTCPRRPASQHRGDMQITSCRCDIHRVQAAGRITDPYAWRWASGKRLANRCLGRSSGVLELSSGVWQEKVRCFGAHADSLVTSHGGPPVSRFPNLSHRGAHRPE